MIRVGGHSDRGQRRDTNEDAFAAVLDKQVYVVADGVGGNSAGEIASRTAVRTLVEEVEASDMDLSDEFQVRQFFSRCLDLANANVVAIGESYPENTGLATTMVICYVRGNVAYFTNVGDSRGYVIRTGRMARITEDHSYVHTLVRMGVLTEEEAKNHRRGNVITRAVGAEDTVVGDFYPVLLKPGDRILLCSDGLYGELTAQEILTIIEEHEDMQQLSEALVAAANEKGGRDNITALMIEYTEGGVTNEQ